MKHLKTILLENGYKTYRFGYFSKDQMTWVQNENKRIMEREDLIFVEGNRTTETSSFYYPCNEINFFSSMALNGLRISFIKDEDFDNPIIWGLNEHGLPPTLVYPRPKIRVKRIINCCGGSDVMCFDETHDSSMQVCLKNENHLDIFNALRNDNIYFEYNLTLIK